ncbi:Leucine-rich repeat protein kinase family protein [Melia azedarach]|uniref:Leucine-rich repeat protein kinase family protein n=1 Tax=Melia azedarach TaxID=155640 RepID=A0ACC1Y576_MELAZ|nr:Leucine-rich repeat protein kinase family protein [Melia azedarach]
MHAVTEWCSMTSKVSKGKWKFTPPNWIGHDPCGDTWEGIKCSNERIISITNWLWLPWSNSKYDRISNHTCYFTTSSMEQSLSLMELHLDWIC